MKTQKKKILSIELSPIVLSLILTAMLVLSTAILSSCTPEPSDTTDQGDTLTQAQSTEDNSASTESTESNDSQAQPEEQEKEPVKLTAYVNKLLAMPATDGMKPSTPVATVEAAIAKLAGMTADEKSISVKGTVRIENADFTPHADMITIFGEQEAVIEVGYNDIYLGGPTTIDNITLRMISGNKFICTNGNPLYLGEGIKRSSTEGISDELCLHIGKFNADSPKEHVELNTDVKIAHLGSFYNEDTHVTNGATLIINKGRLSTLSIGADGWSDQQKGVVFTDTVSIVYNGGELGEIVFQQGQREAGFEGAVQLIANNGLAFPSHPEFVTSKGFYYLGCENNGESRLEATDECGTFKVVGEKYARATDKNGTSFVSANGILFVPAGEYEVTFHEGEIYTNDGTKIEIKQDCELDIMSVYHTSPEGKLFMGWKRQDNAPITKSMKKGDVLVASYVDFDLSKDFPKPTVSISTDGSTRLLFTAQKSDAFDNFEVKETGIIVADTSFVATRPMDLIATQALWGAHRFLSTDIGYSEAITSENVSTMYSARGYCIYNDAMGNESVIYTDIINTSFYNEALKALEEDSYNDEQKRDIKALVSAARDIIREKYDSDTRTDVVGSSADKKNWIYKLKTSGLMVREAEIDTGSNARPITIVQITDLHFNYCNERDFEEANPSIMATYAGRKWLANGSSVGKANNCLDYASFADQIVITGDMLDYMSWGCFELAKTHVFDRFPGVIATMGNHEATRRCQDTPATPDPTTLESRLEILGENWVHDTYYYSKVLDERLMLIQLDNSTGSKFFENQIEPLKADLELAREKGYTVLLFYHIPLCTYNPEESDLYPIRRNDTNNYDYSTKGIGAPGANETTQTVYDIITNSADVIKGAFCGHMHSDYYTEIIAKTPDGEQTVIPQYVLTGAPYDNGHVLRITVK